MSGLRRVLEGGYLVSAVALAFAAAHGSRLHTLYLVGGALLVVSVLLGVLELLGVADPAAGISLLVGGVLVLVGLAMFAFYYWVSRSDGLPVVAGVVFYLGAGSCILGWRSKVATAQEDADGPTVGTVLPSLALLVVGAVAILVGLVLVPSQPKVGAIIAGLGLAVLLPVGVNLGSENLVSFLRQGSAPLRGTVSAVGVVVAAAVFVWVALKTQDWKTCGVVLGVLALAVLCITVRWRMDTALALVAFAFVTAAPLETGVAVPQAGQGEHALVSVGDSYMSGEGATTFYAGTDDAGGNSCRRAPTAYAARVVADQGSPFDGLTFLACSGATARNLLVSPGDPAEQYDGQGTQIGELEGVLRDDPDFTPALVIVGVGGNDAGFSRLGQTCIAPGSCSDPRVAGLFTKRLPEVEASIEEVYRQLHELLPATPVLAVPYPMPISDARTCNGVPLDRDERRFIRTFLVDLDDAIRQAAKATQTYYLAGMQDAIAAQHLELCESKNPGINFLKLKGTAAITSARAERFDPAKWIHDSLHPNARGHAAMAEALRQWDTRHAALLAHADREVGDVTPVPASADTRDAELGGANTWALDQVRDIWPWVLLVLVGTAGIWVAIVASYAVARPQPREPTARG